MFDFERHKNTGFNPPPTKDHMKISRFSLDIYDCLKSKVGQMRSSLNLPLQIISKPEIISDILIKVATNPEPTQMVVSIIEM